MLVATSFSHWSVVGWRYVGLANYEAMFRDPSFWKAAENTAIYAAVGVFIQVPLGCAAGIILSQRPPGWRIFRTILFLPFVISGAAYALVFSMFYNPRYGLLDSALGLIGPGSPPRLAVRPPERAARGRRDVRRSSSGSS